MFRFIIIFSIFLTLVNGSRILFYLSTISKSHVMLALPIAEELAERGHQVTFVTNQKFNLKCQNCKEIVVEPVKYESDVTNTMLQGNGGLGFLLKIIDTYQRNNLNTLKSSEMKKLLKEESFDLIFFLSVFYTDFQLGIADYFKAPYVVLSPLGNTEHNRDLIGALSFVSTVPTKFMVLPVEMNFFHRVKNFASYLIFNLIHLYEDYKGKNYYNELWPSSEKYQSYAEIKQNCSAVLYNGHWTENKIIRPTLPNEIDIGGIQISPKPKPLESDVQKFLDEARDGVILWTFGTNLFVSDIEPNILKEMFKVLGGLKQKVLIKWESDDTSMIPKNFMARKWLAQDSILAHKNVKLFITHGGHGGTMEAMYHQVPIFGVPFYGDQDENMAKAKSDGWGLSLKIFEINQESFSKAINELLTNPKYKEKVTEMSEMYRSRPHTPLEESVFWIEYILRHHGAPHLSYQGKNLNFFQLYSLDVIGFIAFILFWVSLYVKSAIKMIQRKIFRKPQVKTTKKIYNKKKRN